jgi:hypothetical protein
MFAHWDEDLYEIDVKKIKHLYELRHACNVLGSRYIAKELGVTLGRISALCASNMHGSLELLQFLKISNDRFEKLVEQHEQKAEEYRQRINDIHEKNERLIFQLKRKRKEFAGIGTNKAKRRLNKLAPTNTLAKAVRLALEVEDKSISAKKAYGIYQEKIYKNKTTFILDLCKLFKEQGWNYGIQKSDVPPTSHVIYFEIPTCEQISWHFTPEKCGDFPMYKGEWDKKPNSTIRKLEAVAERLLQLFPSKNFHERRKH